MNIFKKRPLSLILCIMLGGFSFFVDSSSAAKICAFLVSLAIIVATFVFNDLFSSRAVLVRVASIAFAAAILLAHLFSIFFVPMKYIGKNVEIIGEVKEVQRSQYSTTVILKTDRIDGDSASHKLLIRGSTSLSGLISGDKIVLYGIPEEFAGNGDGFDQRSYYFSRGYSAIVSDVEVATVIDPNDEFKTDLLIKMRNAVTGRLKLETNAHTGGFLSALIMGDKSALDPNTNLNYSLIGISHILALSGMHLVILSEAVRQVLSKFKLNKKIILLASTLFCLFYMALTGFSASVVRSAVMLTITNGLFLLTGTHDSYTTLPLSVLLILCVQPYAVYDISLWLSAFATLGVLVFGEFNRNIQKGAKRSPIISILVWIWQSILATVLAIGASYPIILKHFESSSIFAPLTTMIFSAPINFLIFAGFAILLLHPIIPLGAPTIFITDTINEAAEWVASIQWATYSMDYLAVKILVVTFCIAFYALLILEIKKFKTSLALIIALFFSSSILGVVLTQTDRYTPEFSYTSTNTSDYTIIKFNGEVSIIRTGSLTSSAAYTDAENIKNQHLTSINNIVLTTYRQGTIAYAQTFFSNIKTETLYLPEPKSLEEGEIATDMAELLSTYGTTLQFYPEERPMKFGECTYYPLKSEPYREGHTPDCAYMIRYEDEYYTYLSLGMTEYNLAFSQRIAYSSDHIIFGSQGDRPSSSHYFPLNSDFIKSLYYSSSDIPLSEISEYYYRKKGVPITKIDTHYEFTR